MQESEIFKENHSIVLVSYPIVNKNSNILYINPFHMSLNSSVYFIKCNGQGGLPTTVVTNVMGTGVGRLPDATHVITTGGCAPPMQRTGLRYTEGT